METTTAVMSKDTAFFFIAPFQKQVCENYYVNISNTFYSSYKASLLKKVATKITVYVCI